MFSISKLKKKARNVLSYSYWNCVFFNSFIIILRYRFQLVSISYMYVLKYLVNIFNDMLSPEILSIFNIMGFYGTGVFASLLTVIIEIFLINPILVGIDRFYILAANKKINNKSIFFAFSSKKRYFNVVWTMFYRDCIVILCSLLFIIPGIIKMYSYYFISYGLADNLDIDREKAIDLSLKMSENRKFKIFLLDLSIIGWLILCLLTLFIGYFFIPPYIHATRIQLYLYIKNKYIN